MENERNLNQESIINDLILNKIEDFKNLPIKTELYAIIDGRIKKYLYFGLNPRCEDYVMLNNSYDVSSIECFYFYGGDSVWKNITFYTSYDRVSQEYIKYKEDELKSIIKIYGK